MPAFNKNITNYTVAVDNNVTSINVGATLESKAAVFETGCGPRTVTLNVGPNTIEIKIKAESGEIKTYTITVTRQKAVEKIEIKTGPTKLSYVEGQKLDLTGLAVTVTYTDNNGTEDIALEDFSRKGIVASLENGTTLTIRDHNAKPIKLTMGTKTANTNNLTVVAKEVTEILVKVQPTKLSYIEGQKLDLTGIVATLKYNDGETEDVAFANFATKKITTSPVNGAELIRTSHNAKPVVLTCNGKTANTSNLTVAAKELTGIVVKAGPTKLSYKEGDKLNLEGLVATLTYNNGLSEDVAFANFATKGITTSPTNGTELTIASHNAKPIVLTSGSKTANTNNLTVTIPPELEIESDEYTIEDNCIIGVPAQTTVEELLENVESNYEIEVYDKDGNEITDSSDAKVTTGTKVVTNEQEFIVIIKGDTNQDGKVNFFDIVKIISIVYDKAIETPECVIKAAICSKSNTTGKPGFFDITALVTYVYDTQSW